ncbi:NUDIX hydrolase [Actinacidiphila paucisporea]|uniref:NUDIX hydrolase n=1 Tax=Actinacidiphila paucisporea TaxID=310782 RepID=UPI0009369DB3|nr:NUDIX hydrolase [Actinacidiphila paucisporea]
MADTEDQPLAADDRGNALLSFTRGNERTPPGDAPLPAALVALWHAGRVLMVFDRYRRSWELPGGRIEVGESPRQAAVRELMEESGQEAGGPLQFVGYARSMLAPDQRTEYAALFTGHCAEIRDFQVNDEITAIHWWDLIEALPGHLQPMDAYLAELTR